MPPRRITFLANKVQSSELNVQHGAYHYNSTTQTFSPEIPPVAPDNYNLTQATVTHTGGTAFARVFNMTSFSVQATAIAAHRPRDVAIVLDYSGSMNNESDIWNCETYLGSLINTPNNTDSVFPQYGWYSTSFSPLATLQCTSSSSQVGKCNVTTSVSGVPALVDDFYQNSFGASSPIAAFNQAPATVTNTAPGGDVPLNAKSSGSAAKTWQDITGSTSTLFKGYANYNGKFYGYTQGPGYWGMTFFAWPPDPNPANDSRNFYFFLSDGKTPLNDNTKAPLTGTSGSYPMPSGNYVINYKAILAWIQANCIQQSSTDNKPFPPVLRAGNVLYYDQVPTDVPASAYNHTQLNSAITDPNQRFWKEYIDFVLGVWRDPTGTV